MINFIHFTAEDGKTEDGPNDDHNLSKMSYSTNDISNITPSDVDFTSGTNNLNRGNGNISTDNNTESNFNTKTEINDNEQNVLPNSKAFQKEQDNNGTRSEIKLAVNQPKGMWCLNKRIHPYSYCHKKRLHQLSTCQTNICSI